MMGEIYQHARRDRVWTPNLHADQADWVYNAAQRSIPFSAERQLQNSRFSKFLRNGARLTKNEINAL
jgi:hypothetical protein